MIHVRRMLLVTLVVAGCNKTAPTGPTAATVNTSTVPRATDKGSRQVASSSEVVNAAENVRPSEQGPRQVATREVASPDAKAHPEQAQAMLAAAEKAWEATRASYEVGTTTLDNLHLWSRQLLLAERAVADTKEKDLAALVAYWKRNKKIYLKVRALNNSGTRGGEMEKFAAATFYVAEAELWLLDAGGEIPDETD